MQLADFIRRNETARPNAKQPIHEIRSSDIVYLDDHPCRMFNPPKIYHLQSISGDEQPGEVEEKVVRVRGVSVTDGKEYDEMYDASGEVEFFFVDKHDEREWLVVGLFPRLLELEGLIGGRCSLQTRREGTNVFLRAPGDLLCYLGHVDAAGGKDPLFLAPCPKARGASLYVCVVP